MRKPDLIITAACLVLFLSCRTGEVQNSGQLSDMQKADSGELIGIIAAMNRNSPGSFDGQFYIDGFIHQKKYKTLGNATFSKDPRKLNVTITDFVFKSALTVLVQDQDEIHLFLPVEKKLFIDSASTMRLRRYGDIDFNFYLLSDLFTGSVPLLKGYRIVNSVVDKEKNTKYLILENDELFETISFATDIPDKILFVRKDNKERVEFYLQKPVRAGGCCFFRDIRIIAKGQGVNINVSFSSIKLNVPVNVKTIKDIRLPKNVNVIKM